MPLTPVSGPVLASGGALQFERERPKPEPSALDVAASLSRELTLAGAAYSRFANPDYGDPTEDPEFEPLDNIQGYEEHARELGLSRSKSHLNGMKLRIDQHRQDQDVLERAGVGFKTQAAVGLLDPTFLAAVAVPELALAKSARLGGFITEAARGGVQASVYEAGMHALDETRSAGESALNVGGGMLLGGILGAGLSRRTPRGELERVRAAFNVPRSEVGAASALPETTLEQQSLAAGGDLLTKAISKVPLIRTDMDIVLASDSVAAKRALEALADIPGVLTKNIEGQATLPSVYNLTQRHVARVADYVRAEDAAWTAYAKRVPKAQRLTRQQFSEEIAHAMRSEDQTLVPEAQQAVKVAREGFDRLYNDAKKLGIAEDPAVKAHKRIEKKAVDDYVKAERAQIYADYSARLNQAGQANVTVKADKAPLADVKIETPADGEFIARSANGQTLARRRGDRLQITDTQTSKDARGSGEGTARIKALVDYAQENGLNFSSDTKVSDQAVKVYERLEQRGYTVIRNEASPDGDGNLVSDSSNPVFEVTKAEPPGDTFTGEGLSVAERSSVVRQQLKLATDAETKIRDETLSDIDAKVSAAEDAYDKKILDLKKERELNQKALAEQNEVSRASASKESASSKEAVRDQLALALSIERQVRNLSVEKAELALEASRRNYRAELVRISRDVEPGKKTEARLRAKIANEKAATEYETAIGEANTQFAKARGELVSKYGKDEIRAASRAARESPSLREAYEFGRNLERAKFDLHKEITSISKARAAERKRYNEAVGKLNKEAQAELEKLSPATQRQFMRRAERVNRSGEPDASEEVTRLAKLLKDQELGKLSDRVTLRDLRENEGKEFLAGDKSYFRRMWDQKKIRANRAAWETMLRTHFGGASDPEVAAAVADVTSQLLHNDIGLANWGTKVSVPEAGPLKGRTLDIPTNLAEPFLVNDPVKVLESYTRDLAPQVELARRFEGDVNMESQLGAIQDEFRIKKEAVHNSDLPPKEKSALLNELDAKEKAVSEALVRVRDRVLNRATVLPESDRGREAVMKIRGWRNWVAATRMGGVAMTGGMMDTARIAATYGFMPTIAKLAKLATSKEFRDLSYAQARRVGAAVEVALARRAYDAFNGAMTDGWTQGMLHGVYKYTGLSHMTDFSRVLAGTLLEDKLIRSAAKIASGGKLSKFEAGRLASLGFDESALRKMAAEVEKHGGDVDGVSVSGSNLWDDQQLASLYDSALLKESQIVVQQPGAADRVWWMDTEIGKLIGQLKTFSLSTPMRMTVTPVQMFANGEALNAAKFVGFMMVGGYLTHAIRQTISGKQPATDPVIAAQQAFSEAGLAGILPDIVSPANHLIGSALKDSNPEMAQYFGGPVRYSDRNPISAFGGPSLGAALDVWDFAYNRAPQGNFTANDLHAGRRLLPGQNVWWLRRGINALEGETADALNLEGAQHRNFGDYFTGFE